MARDMADSETSVAGDGKRSACLFRQVTLLNSAWSGGLERRIVGNTAVMTFRR
jgi:hypothetical protein